MIEVWIYMEKAALQTAWDAAHPTDDSPIPDNVQILNQGVRGYQVAQGWKDYPDGGNTYEVVNVLEASIQPILDFRTAHASDILDIDGWTQGNGLDNDLAQDSEGNTIGFPTVPQRVLDVMPDHIEYDEDGNVISTTPPTFANPNWPHLFFGQSERVFAGQFGLEFSREFF